jgi:hypothetical protein
MADTAGETPEQNQGETPDSSQGETPEAPDDVEAMKAALKKANAEAAKLRLESKANADRQKAAEDADKSELQKANDQKALAEARAAKAEGRLMRLEIAAAKGLSLAMAGRLQGETQEELEADADELLTELKPGPKPGDTSNGRPREVLRSGSAPDAKPEENDPTKLAAMIPRG